MRPTWQPSWPAPPGDPMPRRALPSTGKARPRRLSSGRWIGAPGCFVTRQRLFSAARFALSGWTGRASAARRSLRRTRRGCRKGLGAASSGSLGTRCVGANRWGPGSQLNFALWRNGQNVRTVGMAVRSPEGGTVTTREMVMSGYSHWCAAKRIIRFDARNDLGPPAQVAATVAPAGPASTRPSGVPRPASRLPEPAASVPADSVRAATVWVHFATCLSASNRASHLFGGRFDDSWYLGGARHNDPA
jgi:hypothetical protein